MINKPKDSEVENVADYHSGHYCCYGLVVLAMCDSQLCFIATTSCSSEPRLLVGTVKPLQSKVFKVWKTDL
jgi:hypothetical protein